LDDPGVCVSTGERNAVWNVEIDGRNVTDQMITNMFTGRKYSCILNYRPTMADFMCSQKTCRFLVFKSVDVNPSEIVVLFPPGRFVVKNDSKETLREILDRMTDNFFVHVRDLKDYDRIIFCGHSMGAVMAQMMLSKWLTFHGTDSRAYACGSGAYQWADQAEVDVLPHDRMHFMFTKFSIQFRAKELNFGDGIYKIRAKSDAVFMEKSAYALHSVHLGSLQDPATVKLIAMLDFAKTFGKKFDADTQAPGQKVEMRAHYWSTYLQGIAEYLRNSS